MPQPQARDVRFTDSYIEDRSGGLKSPDVGDKRKAWVAPAAGVDIIMASRSYALVTGGWVTPNYLCHSGYHVSAVPQSANQVALWGGPSLHRNTTESVDMRPRRSAR